MAASPRSGGGLLRREGVVPHRTRRACSGRAGHVEVQVERDVLELGRVALREVGDVVVEPSSPISSAPHQAKRPGLRGVPGPWPRRSPAAPRCRSSCRRCRRPGNAVEVGAGHDDVRIRLWLGDDVLGVRGPPTRWRSTMWASVPAAMGSELADGRVEGADGREPGGTAEGDGAEGGPLPLGGVALVEDDDADGAGLLGEGDLLTEGAGAPTDQRDVAGREPRRSRRASQPLVDGSTGGRLVDRL